jgi:phosphatidylinositol alpha-1,6-mannosyltransferase
VPPSQLPELYRACDLFALTSRSLPESVEGFGIVYLEAAAFGRPLLAYETGGVSEAVLDGETGLLAPEGDVEALSRALARLMEDATLRQRLGDAGRVFARKFSWESAARVLCDAALALPS